MKRITLHLLLLISVICSSQSGGDAKKIEAWKNIYRATPTKINDLIHTKLDLSFDFTRSWMYGNAWITLKPHFYSTDSLNLDAKSMEIKEVSMLKAGKSVPLKFTYDGLKINITLDRTYKGGETYTVYINYIAKPEENREKGSAAISASKGIYFINPRGEDKDKPTQVWTQGETESNSGWVPTIDKPNQKTTNEISLTVPSRFQTLSNGLLIRQKKHSDGTRTDTWKMDLPHAPYLMMIALGEYSIIKDRYKNKEVSYYVEKEYAPVARKIFGLTPEMIDFFSKITGVDYPWQKYSQVVVRDYVSGAMENTTATLHEESAQQDARQLIDENSWEDVISHELFHMWFGDYVTTESWSNITINESFADFSELLWREYKYGTDAAGELDYESLQAYLYGNSSKKDLVRFYYKNREDVFDVVSYQKGGRILNMLRNYIGDSAFYRSMNLFLTTHKFKSAEAQELRLAFEEVSGKDLNWFWNQWFYGSGHPKLEINYDYDQTAKTAKVIVKQTQADKIFRIPVAIDIYQGVYKRRYNVWLQNKADTLTFPSDTKPELINVDGDKILLCEKTDNKTLENYIFQYHNAGLYLDRREAIDFAAKQQASDPEALSFLKNAVNDRFQGLRIYAIQKFNLQNDSVKILAEPMLVDLANNDPSSLIRASAVQALGRYKKTGYRDLFLKLINDPSYSVSANALLALVSIDTTEAFQTAKRLSNQHVKGELSRAIDKVMYTFAGDNEFDALAKRFDDLTVGNEKFMLLQSFSNYLKRINNEDNFRKGIDLIVKFRESVPIEYSEQVLYYFNSMILNSIATEKEKSGKKDLAEYVKSKIGEKGVPHEEE